MLESAVRDLLSDYIYVQAISVGHWSSDLQKDTQAVVRRAKHHAEKIGYPWDDDIVPPDVRDMLNRMAGFA